MRKRRVGINEEKFFDSFPDILKYIKENKEIDDIIISGGDPFLLDDEKIGFIIEKIRNVKKDSIIRIHTRTLSTLPERVTSRLCAILKKHSPVFINTHFNHPMEITDQASEAAARLADSGVVLGCQSVFLKGVNNDYKTLSELFTRLLKIRIKPYYLHHPDPVKGTDHLKPDPFEGIDLMKQLRGRISGMAVPHYMIDLPEGGGKVPLLPEYIKKRKKDYLFIENFKGKIYKYPI